MPKKIPDRWQAYEPMGRCIEGTRLITFKVPLKKVVCDSLPPRERFAPQDLMQRIASSGKRLGLIIDLTNTKRYYNGDEFLRAGVEYCKIFTQGRVIPEDKIVQSFKSTIERFLRCHSDENLLIGVHCTHGVNRTGYLVCRYMIECLGMVATEALAAYASARGYMIERENYISDLHRISDARRALGAKRAQPAEKASDHSQQLDGAGLCPAPGSAQASHLVDNHKSRGSTTTSTNSSKRSEKRRQQRKKRKQDRLSAPNRPPDGLPEHGQTPRHVTHNDKAQARQEWQPARQRSRPPRKRHFQQPMQHSQAPGPDSSSGHQALDLAQFGRGPDNQLDWSRFHGYRRPRPAYRD